MLKHEDNPEISSRPAAQVRVTPEELAQALSRIEARKDAGSRSMDGTISIGEAVQHLGVDTTPEEVLAEVQEERARQKKRTLFLPVRRRTGFALAVGAGILGLTTWRMVVQQPPSPPKASLISTATGPSATVAASTIPDQTPRYLKIDSDILQVGTASGRLVLMSEVGDNQTFHTRLYGSRDWGDYFPGSAMTTWTLIKHDGHVYLRGWVERMSEKLLQAHGAHITNHRGKGNVVPITLSLEGFKVVPDGGSSETWEFQADDVQLDRHAYEKWNP